MRLVTEFRAVKYNPTMMWKHMRLRVRQTSLNQLTIAHPNYDIMMLNHEATSCKKTKIQIVEEKNGKSISYSWAGLERGVTCFLFLKYKAAEATMIADGIIPFLVHKYGDTILQYFDPETVTEKSE